MRMCMITGDSPLTAQNIGNQIGLRNCSAVITGPELDELREDVLRSRMQVCNQNH